jgi:hypothetical protein
MNYSYWESFVKTWYSKKPSSKSSIFGWSDPDIIPLYGNPSILSSCYLPEPWWGNAGTTPLHSVVINFNPGRGYCKQMLGKVPYMTSYAKDLVNTGALPINDNWHLNKRALPLLSALAKLGYKKTPHCLNEHLSVELIPWRTPTVNTNYKNYLKCNIKEIYNNSICFAANESKRIVNKKLNSVVILRFNLDTTKYLLNKLKTIGQSSCILSTGYSSSGKGAYAEFSLASIPDVRFISVWGPRSRNNFPPQNDLDEIVKKI